MRYEANERCSAGTGETVEGLCGRLGRSLEDAVALAEASPDGVTVTSRCAVFAKSELTHFANQGESHGRIFRGLFEGVARNVHSLYDKSKIDGPVLLIGHGALITPIAAGIAGLSDAPVAGGRRRPACSRRSARCASPRARAGERRRAAARRRLPARRRGFPADPQVLVRPRAAASAASSRRAGGRSRCCASETRRRGTAPSRPPPAVLGLDLGSTGSKAALRRPRYRRRAGRASTGAPRATPSRRRRRWSRSCRESPAPWSPSASPARAATPRRPCSAPPSRSSAGGSWSRTRSSLTPRPPRRSIRTAAAASRSSRSAARTPSSSTSRTAASWTRT